MAFVGTCTYEQEHKPVGKTATNPMRRFTLQIKGGALELICQFTQICSSAAVLKLCCRTLWPVPSDRLQYCINTYESFCKSSKALVRVAAILKPI